MQAKRPGFQTARALFFAAMLGAGTIQAQTTQQSADSDTEADAPAELGLDLGEPVPEDELAVGQMYEVEKNGDWTVRCVKTNAEKDPCEMYQLLSNSEGTPIAEIMLFELPEGQQAAAGASVIVPLETSLQQQLTIRVDQSTPKRYPFAYCDTVGCHARIGLTDEEIGNYRRGAEAAISIVPIRAPDQRVTVSMSLSGFTASFNKVAELNGT
ncbi:MAG: invasion associated locus B family protein [Pseudomonadota bacterium]